MTGYGSAIVFQCGARVDHTTPAYRWQTGQLGTITDNGAGDLTHTLGADFGIDATEILPFFTRDGAAAASGAVTFGIANTSDVAKRVTVLQEAALGAASALTDIDYWMAIWKLVIRT